jgi:hypothetical protein
LNVGVDALKMGAAALVELLVEPCVYNLELVVDSMMVVETSVSAVFAMSGGILDAVDVDSKLVKC